MIGIIVSMRINLLTIEDHLINFIIQLRSVKIMMNSLAQDATIPVSCPIPLSKDSIIHTSIRQTSASYLERRERHAKRGSYARLFTLSSKLDTFLPVINFFFMKDWVNHLKLLSSGNLTMFCLPCQKWLKKRWRFLINWVNNLINQIPLKVPKIFLSTHFKISKKQNHWTLKQKLLHPAIRKKLEPKFREDRQISMKLLLSKTFLIKWTWINSKSYQIVI